MRMLISHQLCLITLLSSDIDNSSPSSEMMNHIDRLRFNEWGGGNWNKNETYPPPRFFTWDNTKLMVCMIAETSFCALPFPQYISQFQTKSITYTHPMYLSKQTLIINTPMKVINDDEKNLSSLNDHDLKPSTLMVKQVWG